MLTTSTSLKPPQRALSRMVYDPVNRQIILLGGDHLDRLLSGARESCFSVDYLLFEHRILRRQYAALPMWAYDQKANEWALVRRMEDKKSVPYQRAFYISFTTMPSCANSMGF
jgi:hypothetical protein